MNELPQLRMIRPNMDNIPPLILPKGFSLHNHTEGNEKTWEEIIKKSFEMDVKFSECMETAKGYKPEYLLYIAKDGVDIATTAAIETDKYDDKGWFHMVATVPEARGQGTGKLVCIAALQSLAARGFKSAGLTTDDERIPAIKLYLSLGFEPCPYHESHPERWEKVLSIINK